MSESVFQVQGMTCGACSASVTTALQAIAGVSDVSVSLLTEEAKVVHGPEVAPQALVAAIEACGFDATLSKTHTPLVNTVVSIKGMTCGACSASITEALNAIPGVDQASVSLVTESGLVRHSAAVSTAQIVSTVEDCGFDITIDSSKPIKKDTLHTTVAIVGMTCASCVGSITTALRDNEHISEVAVSLITEEGSVEHTTQITPEEIKEIIENCGFDARIIKSSGSSSDAEEEVVKLQISGIDFDTDLSSLQYNVEAYLNSVNGVTSFELTLNESNEQVQDVEDELVINELAVSFNSSILGIRQLLHGLNEIAQEIEFTITNSVDQSSSAQLKILSRIKEIEYWRHNFFHSLALGLPVVIVSHTQEIEFWKRLIIFPGLYVVSLLQMVVTVYVYLVLGKVFLKKFSQFIRNRGKNATMDVLVCISISVSFMFSILSIVFSVWKGQTIKPPIVLFDTACMLVIFISFGKWLENKAKGATSTALSKLLSLTPTNCTIINDTSKYDEFVQQAQHNKGEMIDLPSSNISVDLIQPNDVAIVLPGGKVPADGLICFGETDIDESLITGESLPVFKTKGDYVIGGSINGPDLIHIRVVRSGKKSQLQQIINLVKESQINKAPSQGFADYIAARFVPGVILLSTVTFIFWSITCYVLHPDNLPMIFKNDDNGKFFVCLKLAISVVVVACPCALGLAAPTAIMVGTGVGASHGVLIKGGDILEKALSINVILFDKTGTVTTGEMVLNKYKMVGTSSLSEHDWWNLIGAVEASSEHPVGRAIVRASKEKLGLTFEEDTFSTTISEFKALAGLGVKATVTLESGKAHEICIGNQRMIEQMSSKLLDSGADIIEESTNSLAYVIIDNQYCGYLELEDEIKDNARDVLDHLRIVEGYQVGMVTGDNRKTAAKIGKELGIPESNIFSEVSPINKDKVIVDLKKRLGGDQNVGIAFVGDGINDAPALVQADIGMAMSSGTDVAIESADIVLIGGKNGQSDLSGVLNALKISNATFKRVKLNFVWAAAYNMIMLPFAMGCFLPLNLMLPPIFAGAAMAMSSISVVVNSLMLKKMNVPLIEKGNYKYDLEREIGMVDLFSLKSGTLQEFDMVKRNRKTRHSIRAKLRQLLGRNRTSQAYEMLPAE
ncbi:heavy metal translocatin [Suhomyces tanzawaensis NRRL Y-17324]|uniref:P-type Cu(+) transporter n=1 Tax=Suhomyces tanzawaensis NRRL Y-17324 TaxID=984487 RepID=A0A1E4SGJ9_9ASCO|nr:heavy metal translocatin [Suhomyces tanzawaensis NRRL Y-17324]ODV78628.1 heavy metal translocatin [Suhomyces tanzawaensis NRRL Y-17324]